MTCINMYVYNLNTEPILLLTIEGALSEMLDIIGMLVILPASWGVESNNCCPSRSPINFLNEEHQVTFDFLLMHILLYLETTWTFRQNVYTYQNDATLTASIYSIVGRK